MTQIACDSNISASIFHLQVLSRLLFDMDLLRCVHIPHIVRLHLESLDLPRPGGIHPSIAGADQWNAKLPDAREEGKGR